MSPLPRLSPVSPVSSHRLRPAVRVATLLAGATILALAVVATRPPTDGERRATATGLLDGIRVTATARATALRASGVSADFGLSAGLRMVRVRVVETLDLELRFEADRDVVLAAPLAACLSNVSWAPDDAGLESRCWGEPDIGPILTAGLPLGAPGQVRLRAGEVVTVRATLGRGSSRCDYPPGHWELTMEAVPVLDGHRLTGLPTLRRPIEVAFDAGAAPPGLGILELRFCSDGAAISRDQGEPP